MPSLPSRIPTRIDDLSYRDLDGRVHRADKSAHAIHGGGYADIFIGYLTENDNTKIKVAIKVLRMVNEHEVVDRIKKYLIRETTVWHMLDHPNVLNFLGLAPDHGRFGCPALISPYCDNGTVNDYLKVHPDIDARLYIIKGVSKGLQYLHHMNVIHGDLKPSNILIHDDGHPLLCDFGRSKILSKGGFTTRPIGACRYQPGELLRGAKPNKASDIYAFAITSYEIWTGFQPFCDIHQDSMIVLHIVMSDARPEYPEPPPLGTESLWQLFEDCWKGEPEERLETEAMVHRLEEINIPQ